LLLGELFELRERLKEADGLREHQFHVGFPREAEEFHFPPGRVATGVRPERSPWGYQAAVPKGHVAIQDRALPLYLAFAWQADFRLFQARPHRLDCLSLPHLCGESNRLSVH